VDVSAIVTARNTTNMVSVAFKQWGYYKLHMTVRANTKSELAQIPLTITKDKEVVGMITLSGHDKEWKTFDMDISPSFSTFYLKFYFAQDGMEIKDITITLEKALDIWLDDMD
jgi:beta-glucosidase